MLTSPPTGENLNGVTGTFKVPSHRAPASATSGTYCTSIWTGLDGATYGNAILQAGVDVTVTVAGGKSMPSFSTWYKWFPLEATTIDTSKFSVNGGDTVNISVSSSGTSKGTIVLKNISSGKSFTQTVSAPSATNVLGGQNAEWIVEDYQANNELVPFVDFGDVNWTSCFASTPKQSVGTTNAEVINIKNGATGVTIPGDHQVNVALSQEMIVSL
jgi:hypothetical protein